MAHQEQSHEDDTPEQIFPPVSSSDSDPDSSDTLGVAITTEILTPLWLSPHELNGLIVLEDETEAGLDVGTEVVEVVEVVEFDNQAEIEEGLDDETLRARLSDYSSIFPNASRKHFSTRETNHSRESTAAGSNRLMVSVYSDQTSRTAVDVDVISDMPGHSYNVPPIPPFSPAIREAEQPRTSKEPQTFLQVEFTKSMYVRPHRRPLKKMRVAQWPPANAYWKYNLSVPRHTRLCHSAVMNRQRNPKTYKEWIGMPCIGPSGVSIPVPTQFMTFSSRVHAQSRGMKIPQTSLWTFTRWILRGSMSDLLDCKIGRPHPSIFFDNRTQDEDGENDKRNTGSENKNPQSQRLFRLATHMCKCCCAADQRLDESPRSEQTNSSLENNSGSGGSPSPEAGSTNDESNQTPTFNGINHGTSSSPEDSSANDETSASSPETSEDFYPNSSVDSTSREQLVLSSDNGSGNLNLTRREHMSTPPLQHSSNIHVPTRLDILSEHGIEPFQAKSWGARMAREIWEEVLSNNEGERLAEEWGDLTDNLHTGPVVVLTQEETHLNTPDSGHGQELSSDEDSVRPSQRMLHHKRRCDRLTAPMSGGMETMRSVHGSSPQKGEPIMTGVLPDDTRSEQRNFRAIRAVGQALARSLGSVCNRHTRPGGGTAICGKGLEAVVE